MCSHNFRRLLHGSYTTAGLQSKQKYNKGFHPVRAGIGSSTSDSEQGQVAQKTACQYFLQINGSAVAQWLPQLPHSWMFSKNIGVSSQPASLESTATKSDQMLLYANGSGDYSHETQTVTIFH